MASNLRVIPTPLGKSSGTIVPGSLVFDSGNSDYLYRTPSYDSSRTTFTISFWVKFLEDSATWPVIFGADTAEPNRTHIRMNAGLMQVFFLDGSSNYALQLFPSRDFRDYSGWMHICVAVDTLHSTSTERGILYINGVRETEFSATTYPSQYFQFQINNNVQHNFGRRGYDGSNYWSGYLADFVLIDGAQRPVTDFGYTDPNTKSWRPRLNKNVGVNDGTVWSDLVSLASSNWESGREISKAFNGNTGSIYPGGRGAQTAANAVLATMDLSSNPITIKDYITVCSHTGYTQDIWITVDGSETSSSPSFGQTRFNVSGSLTQVKWNNNGGSGRTVLQNICVDGVNLVDNAIPGGAWDWIWFGSNGFHLPFDGSAPGNDVSGYDTNDTSSTAAKVKNNFTTGNNPKFSLSSPSGVSNAVDFSGGLAGIGTTNAARPSNYATWNPYDCGDTVSLTKGCLKQSSSTWATSLAKSNYAMTAGKYYWEYNHIQKPSGGWTYMGIIDEMARTNSNADTMYSYDKAWSFNSNGSVTHDDSETAYGDSWSNGDIIGCAFDVDQGKIWFSKNGTWQNSGNPETGANPAYSDIVTSTATYYGGRGNRAYVVATSIDTNTGSGIGELISGAEGFNYTAPKGFLPMCTNNNPTGVSDPSNYFKSLTYTGNNSTNNISCGFQPDIVWVKTCPSTYSHMVFDSVRGRKKDNPGESFYYWKTDDSVSPYQYGTNEHLHSLYGDGFTMFGSSGLSNYTGHKFHTVAWKAGGGNIAGSSGDEFWKDGKQYTSAALADVGSGTITPTACSVGTTPGLSILKYTGTASSGTIAHGLNKTPECIFAKCYTQDNYVYHTNMDPTTPWTWFSKLNTTAVRADGGAVWDDQAPTDTLIHIGPDNAINESGQNILLYAWHSVPGLSKFNHYMGNGNADGNYVHCGFRPSFILIKKLTGTENWQMHTTALNPYNDPTNAAGNRLFANTTAVENTQANLDILGDGFKIRTTDASVNSDATTYFYCAWAEASSSGQYGGQATGR